MRLIIATNIDKVLSSANKHESMSAEKTRSLIYIGNKSGSKTEPCGTSIKKSTELEKLRTNLRNFCDL